MLLPLEQTQKLLAKYQIPLVDTAVIKNKKQGVDFAKKQGWPVVLKIDFEELEHRTELGLVKTNIQNPASLEKALKELQADFPQGRALIQRTAQGVEMFCGLKQDPVFGPFLLFGVGGIFVEVLKDVSFAIAPISKTQAQAMLAKLKGYSLFKGYRGKDPLYVQRVVDILLGLSLLSQQEKQVKEVNINPLFVAEKEVVAADVKIIVWK